MANFSELREAIKRGDAKQSETSSRDALSGGASPKSVLAEAVIPAMHDLDMQFQCQDCEQPELCYVPEQLLANRAIRSALDVIRPALEESSGGDSGGPRVIIGTVEGDRCDLGRDLVAPLLTGAGYDVVDMGTSVSHDAFLEAAAERPGSIIILYTRKTSSAESMKQLKQALADRSETSATKIIAVGHHITNEICDDIGADDFCAEVQATIDKVAGLVS